MTTPSSWKGRGMMYPDDRMTPLATEDGRRRARKRLWPREWWWLQALYWLQTWPCVMSCGRLCNSGLISGQERAAWTHHKRPVPRSRLWFHILSFQSFSDRDSLSAFLCNVWLLFSPRSENSRTLKVIYFLNFSPTWNGWWRVDCQEIMYSNRVGPRIRN